MYYVALSEPVFRKNAGRTILVLNVIKEWICRYNKKQSSWCLDDDCFDKTLYRVAARCEDVIYDRTNFADVFLKASVCYIVSRPFCANVASKMECSLESACCLFGDGLVCL